ncbi:MAG: PAS domain-containing protein, partial [Deltaproteobacteria bacterium]|nr:PAS domain-containing protein [Deltaproteobacteria bacterium]
MRLGLRGKLFLVSVALILVVGLASGAFLEDRLRGWLDARIDEDLEWRLRAARVLVEKTNHLHGLDDGDRLADAVGAATGARVTILARDGRVIGDSHLVRSTVARIDNHRHRPEIVAALRRGWGQSQRYSITDGADLRYRASRFHRADGVRGVVRVALSLEEIERAVHALRLLLVGAGGLGLAIAVLMSGLASHLQWRTFLELLRDPRALAEATGGQLDPEDDASGASHAPSLQLRRELRRAVGALGEERDRFDAILQGLSEAVIALDAGLRVTLANTAAVELLGLERSPVGDTLLEVIRAPAIAELTRAANEGRSGTAELVLHGAAKHVLARAKPLASG